MLTPEDNLLDYVDDYVHGLLSPDEARLVARFCENSKLGQAALEDARQRYEALQQLPPAEASESLIRNTLGAIDTKVTRRERRQKRYLQAVLLVTAASALFISLLNIYYYRLQASPYDLRLLGQAQLLSGSQASLRVAMVDQASGAPVAGVPVHVALYNPSSGEQVQLASATTDEEGVAGPRFQLPSWEEGSYQLRVAARTSRGDERLEQIVQLRRDWRLMLSTDKPVYQPGQTIRLRSLALKKPDLKPIAGQELLFTITDPKGNIIFKRRDVTSRFGIASADCPMAREILEGAYQIRCAIGETASEQTVKVEKYVLPKFQVAVSLGASYYAPGEHVTGHVQADYFFGKPVVNGQVQIEVQATDVGPQTLHRVTLTTDEMGRAPFEFRLPNQMVGREQDSGAARFLVAVQVTDTAGQTATAGSSRVVTSNPIHLEVIPECGRLVVGVRNRVYVVATYADGRPCKARLIINGQEELQTDQLGIAMTEVRPFSDESMIVKAIDSEGRIGQRTVQIASGTNANDFVLRSDKALYRGGETMQLSALGGGSEPVLVDLIRDGQTILSCETTPQATVKDDDPGFGTTAIDLPPDLSGTLEIVAYRFGSQGLPVRKSRVVYVQPANQVAIQVTLDQGTYRPGEQAQIKLRLTGADGRPAPGAISLKAVDEAVYAVLNQKSNLEETFFLLEQELLEPVYTIYPGWNPQLFSNLPTLERERFQQALLARTAQHVEGPGALPPGFCGVIAIDPAEVRVHSPFGGSLRNPFTLSASSFPAKLQEVLLRRDAGLHLATIAWSLLGIGFVLAGVVGFAWFYPKAFLITGVVGMLFGCAGLAAIATLQWTRMEARMGFEMMPDAAVADMEFAEEMSAAEPAAMAGAIDGAMEGLMEDPSSVSQVSNSSSAVPLRIRQWFPETLLWRPELITDDQGEVSLDVDLADSITTWRLTSSAVTASGRLGGAEHPIKVFQPFFVDFDLPVSLTRNDEVGDPRGGLQLSGRSADDPVGDRAGSLVPVAAGDGV